MTKVDPTKALTGFQQALTRRLIKVEKSKIQKDLFIHRDFINGRRRYTYARMDKTNVKAHITFVQVEDFEGTRCFQVGYAVSERYQNQGLAKSTLSYAIDDFRSDMSKRGKLPIYLEGYVDISNIPSNKVASACLSNNPIEIEDEFTNMSSLQYMRKIE